MLNVDQYNLVCVLDYDHNTDNHFLHKFCKKCDVLVRNGEMVIV